jgi:hypothetical protein
MEDLVWNFPELLLNEPLTQHKRQQSTNVGRSDLIFRDKFGRLLIVELKKGVLPRGALYQLEDYFGAVKLQFPETAVEKMVVANSIPPERRIACEQYYIECREIPEMRFRDVATQVGYVFESETRSNTVAPASRPERDLGGTKVSPSATPKAVLLRRFDEAMMSIYVRAMNEAGYKATIYHRMLCERGGLETASYLLHSPKISEGFENLWQRKRLDLTVEALVLDPQWEVLFSEADREIARKRLSDYEYIPPPAPKQG